MALVDHPEGTGTGTGTAPEWCTFALDVRRQSDGCGRGRPADLAYFGDEGGLPLYSSPIPVPFCAHLPTWVADVKHWLCDSGLVPSDAFTDTYVHHLGAIHAALAVSLPFLGGPPPGSPPKVRVFLACHVTTTCMCHVREEGLLGRYLLAGGMITRHLELDAAVCEAWTTMTAQVLACTPIPTGWALFAWLRYYALLKAGVRLGTVETEKAARALPSPTHGLMLEVYV